MDVTPRLVATAEFEDGLCRVEGYANLVDAGTGRMVRALSLVVDNQGTQTCTFTLVTADGTEELVTGPGERREFTFPLDRYSSPEVIDHRNVDYRITYG